MPFVVSTCGASQFLKPGSRARLSRLRRLPARRPLHRRATPLSTLKKSKSKRKDGPPPASAPSERPSRRELINGLLTSRASLVVAAGAVILYALALAVTVHRVATVALPAHERVLLTALAVLLPDFRHVLQTYLGAVSDLRRYRPPPFPFEFSSKAPTQRAASVAAEGGPPSPLDAAADTPSEILANMRALVDAEIAKANSIISEKVEAVTRDMRKPLMETSTTIQQMTIGTDLTLRKNVLVAAITLFLSLLGYFACAAGEVVIGCVVVMIATLLPSAILAPRWHEQLILVNDLRVFISLFGTLSAVLCAFLPLTAAYFFFGACIGLVAVRVNI